VRVRPLEEASFELVRVALEREDALDPAWADDLRQVRGALLPLATRLALERARAGDRTQLLDLLRRAADPGLAPHEFARAWRQVEARLVTLSGNRVLVMLLSSFQGPVESPSPRRRVPLLRRFAVAVEAGDAVMARRILRDLLRHIGGPEKGGDTPSG
jgi:DNA-binding FadR family transcriptional regulator